MKKVPLLVTISLLALVGTSVFNNYSFTDRITLVEQYDECIQFIATGNVVKDGRSIMLKFRWLNQNNQKPIYHEGDIYHFWGVGDGTSSFCRMGMNEVGLALGNSDAPLADTLDAGLWKYTSDHSTGSEDGDLIAVLGNYSTVAEAAYFLANHATHPAQWAIVSKEQGVGAIVAMDSSYHSNITWINNTWASTGSVHGGWYCEDTHSTEATRLSYLVQRGIEESLFSDDSCPTKIGVKDVIYMIGKDRNASNSTYPHYSEPHPGVYTGYYEQSGLSAKNTCFSSMVCLSGDGRENGETAMSWLCISDTVHLGCYLPIGCSYVDSADDLHSLWTGGNGIQKFADVKQDYAEHNSTHYIRKRVHEIRNYTIPIENYTVDTFEQILDSINGNSRSSDVISAMQSYANDTFERGLNAYIYNGTFCYRKIIINSSVTNDTLFNFPVLITINSTIAQKCDGGSSLQFWSESNTTQRPHEIDFWDEAGDSKIWVNVSILRANSDTILWMRYNNSGMDNQENISSTWDSNFVFVHHMHNHNDTHLKDSSPTINDAYEFSTPVENTEGIIGYSQTFDGVSDKFLLPANDSFNITQQITVECWANWTGTGDTYQKMIANYNAWSYYLHPGTGEFQIYVDLSPGDGILSDWIVCDAIVDSWAYYVYSFNNDTNTLRGYMNSHLKNTTTHNGTFRTNNQNMAIGDRPTQTTRSFNGTIDECRLSKIQRNDSWLEATYNTITGDYFTIGPENELYDLPTIRTEIETTNTSNKTGKITIEQTFLVKQGLFGARVFYLSCLDNITKKTEIKLPSTYTYSSWFWETTKTIESVKVFGITETFSFQEIETKGSATDFTLEVSDFDDYKAFLIIPNPGFFQGNWWFSKLNDARDYYSSGESISTNLW